MEKLSRLLRDKHRKYDKSKEAEETVNDLNGMWSQTDAIFKVGPNAKWCLSQGGYYTSVKKTFRPYFPIEPLRNMRVQRSALELNKVVCCPSVMSEDKLTACEHPFDTK